MNSGKRVSRSTTLVVQPYYAFLVTAIPSGCKLVKIHVFQNLDAIVARALLQRG